MSLDKLASQLFKKSYQKIKSIARRELRPNALELLHTEAVTRRCSIKMLF